MTHEWITFATCLVALFCISSVSSRSVQGSQVRRDNNSEANFDLEGHSKPFRSNFTQTSLSVRRHKLSKRNARLFRERSISRTSYNNALKQNASYERKSNETLSTVVGKHKIKVSTRWRDFDVHSYDNGYKIIIKPGSQHEIEIIPDENIEALPLKENWYDTQSTSNLHQNIYPSTETANHRTMSYEDYVKYFSTKDQRFTHGYENVQQYGTTALESVNTGSHELTHGYPNKHETSEKSLGTKPLTTQIYPLSSDKRTHNLHNKVKELENSITYLETKPSSLLNTESSKLSNLEFAHDYQIESTIKHSGTTPLSVNTESNNISSDTEFPNDYKTKFENVIEWSENKASTSVGTESYALSSEAQILPEEFTFESKNQVETNKHAIGGDSGSLNEEYTTHDILKNLTTNIDGFENIELKAVLYTSTEDYSKVMNAVETTSSLDSTFENFIENGKDFNGFEASGFFPMEEKLNPGNPTEALDDSLGDLENRLKGSGDSEVEEFENGLNRSGKIFSLISTQSEFSKCSTPKGEPGSCRRFRDCVLSDALNNFNNFLQYLCLIRGILVGICCPDNPVIEMTDAEPQNSTEPSLQDIKLPPEGCGINSNESRTRIVGGKISTPHEWTWMVALMRKNKFYCGGVIINNWYVLTAAHCVLGINVRDLKVRLGEYNFNSKTDHQRDISVAEIKRHAQFVTLTFQHDIALLKLRRRIEYTNFVGSICLPGQEGRDYSDVNGTVVGWGTVSFGGAASSVLREVTIPVWKNEECDRIYLLENIGDSFLCAGSPDNGEDACQGDSGGPLMALNERGRWEAIGIVSWGRRCGDPTYPGVYTRITSYLDWIRENAQ